MRLFRDSFQRASADCLRWYVILLSMVPLAIMAVICAGYLWATDGGTFMSRWASSEFVALPYPVKEAILNWIGDPNDSQDFLMVFPFLLLGIGLGSLAVALLVFVMAVVVVPAMTRWVVRRRFPGGVFGGDAFVPGGAKRVAGLVGGVEAFLILLLPAWVLTPLLFLLPLLLGWLFYRVMAFEVLAQYAQPHERDLLLEKHRWPLRVIGLLCACLAFFPSMFWGAGLMVSPLLSAFLFIGLWLDTLIFIFGALWYAHYGLQALMQWREQQMPPSLQPAATSIPV